MLKVDGQTWTSEENTLKEGVVDFFCDLYTKEDNNLPNYNIRGHFPQISERESAMLAE